MKAAYLDFEGDMDRIMESVLCADYTDEARIRKIIEEAISSGEVPPYKGFVKESKQKQMARKRRVGYVNQGPREALMMMNKLLLPFGRSKQNVSRQMFATGSLGYRPCPVPSTFDLVTCVSSHTAPKLL